MILPDKQSTVADATQIGGLTPEEMWDKLLAHSYTNPAFLQTDLAFVDEWKKAIDVYGKTFSGITLIVTTGDGLPNLTGPFTFPMDLPMVMTVCPVANMDWAAETTILASFSESTVGGANGKAIQTDGMKGSGPSDTYNLGVPGVKLISTYTDMFTSPSARILGGAQFAMSFKNNPVEEGCISVFSPKGYASVDDVPVASIPTACLRTGTTIPSTFITFDQKSEAQYLISPEQAEYNVLNWYFNDTGAGSFFGGPTAFGQAPLNYLQVYGPDINKECRHSGSGGGERQSDHDHGAATAWPGDLSYRGDRRDALEAWDSALQAILSSLKNSQRTLRSGRPRDCRAEPCPHLPSLRCRPELPREGAGRPRAIEGSVAARQSSRIRWTDSRPVV